VSGAWVRMRAAYAAAVYCFKTENCKRAAWKVCEKSQRSGEWEQKTSSSKKESVAKGSPIEKGGGLAGKGRLNGGGDRSIR